MKTKQELLEMLFAKLAELQDGRIKTVNPTVAKKLQTELNLLWDILGEDVPEEYWEQIEEEIWVMKNITDSSNDLQEKLHIIFMRSNKISDL